MNYDKGKLRLQITKYGSEYSASLSVLPMKHSSGAIFRIVGISKQDADNIKSILMTKGTDMHVVQGIRNKYKKWLKEGKITEKKETGIDVAKRIVKNHQHEKGVDVQTANLIMKIYHAYDKNPALQKKLEKLPLKKLAHGVWKFVK